MDFLREGKLEDLSVENFEKYINDNYDDNGIIKTRMEEVD
jgi:hypothetical protein|tara:strand:- start:35 stop:154 length:120 start_codon:yes stop_codon:yes gene_type:complete